MNNVTFYFTKTKNICKGTVRGYILDALGRGIYKLENGYVKKWDDDIKQFIKSNIKYK